MFIIHFDFLGLYIGTFLPFSNFSPTTFRDLAQKVLRCFQGSSSQYSINTFAVGTYGNVAL